MRLRTALMWTVKPGTEEAVKELFRSYGPPEMIVRDGNGNEIGRMLSALVFMKDNVVVRVVDADVTDIAMLTEHLRKQPAIRELEAKLEQYLEVPRDMSTPEGAQEFFRRAGMELLVARSYEE
jgi:hypothetical protein